VQGNHKGAGAVMRVERGGFKHRRLADAQPRGGMGDILIPE